MIEVVNELDFIGRLGLSQKTKEKAKPKSLDLKFETITTFNTKLEFI